MTKIEYIGKCLLIESDDGKKILVVGDLHLGYEEALNKTGVFVSRKLFDEIIEEFDRVFDFIGKKNGIVNEIVLLGDVKHVFGTVLGQEWGDVLKLIDYFEKKMEKKGKIIITRGNHDTILEPIARKRGNVKLVDYYIADGIAFIHGDKDYEEIWKERIEYVVLGHLHPAVKIREGVKEEKYKCFLSGKWKGKEWIVVSSFAEHSEGIDVRDNDGMGDVLPWKIDLLKFDVRVVDSDGMEARDFGKLGKLK